MLLFTEGSALIEAWTGPYLGLEGVKGQVEEQIQDTRDIGGQLEANLLEDLLTGHSGRDFVPGGLGWSAQESPATMLKAACWMACRPEIQGGWCCLLGLSGLRSSWASPCELPQTPKAWLEPASYESSLGVSFFMPAIAAGENMPAAPRAAVGIGGADGLGPLEAAAGAGVVLLGAPVRKLPCRPGTVDYSLQGRCLLHLAIPGQNLSGRWPFHLSMHPSLASLFCCRQLQSSQSHGRLLA